MGTVELTGLEMMRMFALGQCSAAALARSRTIEALVLKRSGTCQSCFCLFLLEAVHTITGHARLAGDTSGDEDNLGSLEGGGNIGLLVTLDL
jgi:hypothetical protein